LDYSRQAPALEEKKVLHVETSNVSIRQRQETKEILMFAEDAKWMVENLNKLRGARFIEAVYEDPDQGFCYLVFEKDEISPKQIKTSRWFLDIQADPEGNGPGFINVLKAKKKTGPDGSIVWSG
jgi:hypothetical protein